MTIAEPTRRWLSASAREAVAEALDRTDLVEPAGPAPADDVLGEPARVFVSWHAGPRLLGCIGTLQPHASLARRCGTTRCRPALHDPRIGPMSHADLVRAQGEISVLAPESRVGGARDRGDRRRDRAGSRRRRAAGGHAPRRVPAGRVGEAARASAFLAALCRKAGIVAARDQRRAARRRLHRRELERLIAVEGERERVLRLVLRHGWNATSFQTLEAGYAYRFVDDGCVAYVDTGHAWVAAGAPIAAPGRLAAVAGDFVAAARASDRRVCFVATEDRMREATRERLDALQIAEQPVWDPRQWSEQVAAHRSIGGQRRRAENKGVRVRMLDPAELDHGPTREAITAVTRQWLRTRGSEPMGFLLRVDPFVFSTERRCFVAEHEGRIVAFAGVIPVPARRGWFIEDLRPRPARAQRHDRVAGRRGDAVGRGAGLHVGDPGGVAAGRAGRGLAAARPPWRALGLRLRRPPPVQVEAAPARVDADLPLVPSRSRGGAHARGYLSLRSLDTVFCASASGRSCVRRARAVAQDGRGQWGTRDLADTRPAPTRAKAWHHLGSMSPSVRVFVAISLVLGGCSGDVSESNLESSSSTSGPNPTTSATATMTTDSADTSSGSNTQGVTTDMTTVTDTEATYRHGVDHRDRYPDDRRHDRREHVDHRRDHDHRRVDHDDRRHDDRGQQQQRRPRVLRRRRLRRPAAVHAGPVQRRLVSVDPAGRGRRPGCGADRRRLQRGRVHDGRARGRDRRHRCAGRRRPMHRRRLHVGGTEQPVGRDRHFLPGRRLRRTRARASSCLAPADCTALPPDDDCQTRTCVANACGQTFTPNGTPVGPAGQTDGDCQQVVCDGSGGSGPVDDDTDPFDDGLECTDDSRATRACRSTIRCRRARPARRGCATARAAASAASIPATATARIPSARRSPATRSCAASTTRPRAPTCPRAIRPFRARRCSATARAAYRVIRSRWGPTAATGCSATARTPATAPGCAATPARRAGGRDLCRAR